MVRVHFNTTPTITGAYILPLNPSKVDIEDEDKFTIINTLDSGKVKQRAYFNDGKVVMEWNNIPKGFQGFSTMASTLRSYVNSVRYINLMDIEYRAHPTPRWIKTRVFDVKTKIRQGGKVFKTLILEAYREP